MHARHEAKFTVSHFKNTLAGLWSEKERWESTPSERMERGGAGEEKEKLRRAIAVWPAVGEGQQRKEKEEGKKRRRREKRAIIAVEESGVEAQHNGGGNRRKELVWRGRKKSAW